MIWHVYRCRPNRRARTNLGGNYVGEQASRRRAAAGGNWIYGGGNNQVGMQATQLKEPATIWRQASPR